MYAEHVLRVKVDWASLCALKEKKFGGIGGVFTKWFKNNSKLVDDPRFPIPEVREPKKPRHCCRVDNDMETVSGEAIANINDGDDHMEYNIGI